MHVMQEQTDACNAIMIFGVRGWLFKSFFLIKLWAQNWVSIVGKLSNKCNQRNSSFVGLWVELYSKSEPKRETNPQRE